MVCQLPHQPELEGLTYWEEGVYQSTDNFVIFVSHLSVAVELMEGDNSEEEADEGDEEPPARKPAGPPAAVQVPVCMITFTLLTSAESPWLSRLDTTSFATY
jgi:hypothetical protein